MPLPFDAPLNDDAPQKSDLRPVAVPAVPTYREKFTEQFPIALGENRRRRIHPIGVEMVNDVMAQIDAHAATPSAGTLVVL